MPNRARLVSFVDFAPTMLSLCGVEPPAHFHGKAFLGPHRGDPPEVAFGFRGRMDERYDLVRVARDCPIHLHPQLHAAQGLRAVRELHVRDPHHTGLESALRPRAAAASANRLSGSGSRRRSLYDLSVDPDEVANLAGLPQHTETLQRLRAAQQAWALQIRDVGFLPEGEIHRRAEGRTPYEMGHDEDAYPLGANLAYGRSGVGAARRGTSRAGAGAGGRRQCCPLLGGARVVDAR